MKNIKIQTFDRNNGKESDYNKDNAVIPDKFWQDMLIELTEVSQQEIKDIVKLISDYITARHEQSPK